MAFFLTLISYLPLPQDGNYIWPSTLIPLTINSVKWIHTSGTFAGLIWNNIGSILDQWMDFQIPP